MKELTVSQLAAISGVTVRTLHHYDELGLLKPACVGANGYRYYGRSEQLRLQRILFHRELGVPLNAIGGLLELEGEDQIGVLAQHRDKLQEERERYRVLIETIDRTIEELRGETQMNNADLYKGFSPEKQAGYEAWLIEHYGEPMRAGIERANKAFNKMSATERQTFMDQQTRKLHDIEQALAGALRNAVDPASDAVDALIGHHRNWVSTMWGRHCPPDNYAGLADLYLSHPDFVARYETIEKGFAEYLAAAMKLHAKRASG
jgi:DNA-binding transcriptional MerR regulator